MSTDETSISSRSALLNRKLSQRPHRDELVERGIISESQCAPSLHQAEKSLKRSRLQDELNSRLSDRPGPLDLIQKNILHVDPIQETSQLEQAIRGLSFFAEQERQLIRMKFFSRNSRTHIVRNESTKTFEESTIDLPRVHRLSVVVQSESDETRQAR